MTAPFGTAPFGLAPFGGLVPSDLREGQFELAGVRFGDGLPVDVQSWTRSGSDSRTQDQPAGWGDSLNFGRDRKTPGTWSWVLLPERDGNLGAVLGDLEDLEALWDAPDTRDEPQGVLSLRYRIAGRTRIVFGRPRRFTPAQDNLMLGIVPIVADFQLAEPWSYDDVEQSELLTLGAADLDAITTFPVSFPFLWGGSAGRPGTRNITVGGRRPTWLTATITAGTGPLTDPYLIVGDAGVVQLRGTVPAGVSNRVAVSALPWAAGVYRAADGTQAPVWLDARSRVSQLRVGPGQHLLTFGGIDPTGSATCAVSWRDGYNSI